MKPNFVFLHFPAFPGRVLCTIYGRKLQPQWSLRVSLHVVTPVTCLRLSWTIFQIFLFQIWLCFFAMFYF